MTIPDPPGRPRAEVELEVPFHDIDAMQIVWHGRYVKYLEQARTALMRGLGFDDLAVLRQGWMFPVVDLRLRYLRPARLGQRLSVRAELAAHVPMLRIHYQIRDAGAGTWLARASTAQAPVDATTGELCLPPPDALLRRMEQAIAAWPPPGPGHVGARR